MKNGKNDQSIFIPHEESGGKKKWHVAETDHKHKFETSTHIPSLPVQVLQNLTQPHRSVFVVLASGERAPPLAARRGSGDEAGMTDTSMHHKLFPYTVYAGVAGGEGNSQKNSSENFVGGAGYQN